LVIFESLGEVFNKDVAIRKDHHATAGNVFSTGEFINLLHRNILFGEYLPGLENTAAQDNTKLFPLTVKSFLYSQPLVGPSFQHHAESLSAATSIIDVDKSEKIMGILKKQ
jgi:hypothetical protein